MFTYSTRRLLSGCVSAATSSLRNKTTKAKAYIFEKQFKGFPKATDFKLVEEDLRTIKDGEFLAEATYLSVDPYMRGYAFRVPLGTTYIGSQVAKVIESKNPKYPKDKYVVGQFGWRSHTIYDGTVNPILPAKPWIVPELKGLPLSLSLGVLGMPGNTAYFGFLQICQPKTGETVVVSGAAGAVGNHVGQIAKIKGCKVIGIAGSEEKGKWLTRDLGFDHFINYKDADFKKKLVAAAPDGIDCYFDNVGGEISTFVISRMNMFGRVAVCGAISGYNDEKLVKVTPVQPSMVFNQVKMEGFVVNRWLDQWFEGVDQNMKWIKEGKLKYRETVTEGFENMFKAFMDMLQGGNIGKTIVKV